MSLTTAHIECVLAKDRPQGLKGAYAHVASKESLAANHRGYRHQPRLLAFSGTFHRLTTNVDATRPFRALETKESKQRLGDGLHEVADIGLQWSLYMAGFMESRCALEGVGTDAPQSDHAPQPAMISMMMPGMGPPFASTIGMSLLERQNIHSESVVCIIWKALCSTPYSVTLVSTCSARHAVRGRTNILPCELWERQVHFCENSPLLGDALTSTHAVADDPAHIGTGSGRRTGRPRRRRGRGCRRASGAPCASSTTRPW